MVEIADANFKAYLLENFDTNKDGNLSLAETKAIKSIDCSGKDIKSVEGIEKMPNLEYLNCSQNKLEILDLTQNNKLEKLVCTENVAQMNILIGMKSPLKNKGLQTPNSPQLASFPLPYDESKVSCDKDVVFQLNFN